MTNDEIYLNLLFDKKRLEKEKRAIERKARELGVELPDSIEDIDKRILEVKEKMKNITLERRVNTENEKVR